MKAARWQLLLSGVRPLAAMALVAVLLLVGCGSDSDGPSSDEVRSSLEIEFPRWLEIVEFEIEASEQTGSEVSPVIRSRFTAKAELTEPFYESVDRLDDRAIVEMVTPVGTEVEVFGISTSTLRLGSWETEFDEIEIVPEPPGVPLDLISSDGGTPLESGSPEEAMLRQELADRESARQEEIAERDAAMAALADEAVGVWIGEYSCSADGPTGLELTISTDSEPGSIQAIFAFFPVDGSPSIIDEGSFNMSGTVDADGVRLVAGTWIEKPGALWSTVDLEGQLDGSTLSGEVSCGPVSLTRQG